MKRIFDLIISALCLVIFSPLILLCAIAIRLDDGLPVIYTQERIGRNGKPFFIFKFRTMRMDAEENGPMMLEVDGDDRLTRVGKFLREHHLDELPQLWNVLIGDMAFIGPRPDYAKRCPLRTTLRSSPRRNLLCHPLQWLCRYY
mgnify:CR=1 FL=1